jgi:hypothetical protein
MKSLVINYFSFIIFLLAVNTSITCGAQEQFVFFSPEENAVLLSAAKKSSPLIINASDHPGVIRAAKDLQKDILAITGNHPALLFNAPAGQKEIVVIGTIGKSALIDEMVRKKKLDVSKITGKWEAFVVETIDNPMAGVERAVVIAGSDKRGTIFGIYEVSRQIGVSPWYWWADVTPQKRNSLYVIPGRFEQSPVVQYRGIFINDEEPALGRWAVEKYGGFNHQFYEKVFELILRMKGNYLWPAMWWASFNSDDTLNPKLADEYGIVMSTTHHEPMMRAHAEWKTFKGGPWNYATNEDKLKEFWREGIQRMNGFESIVSLGMRGDGDMAMTQETNIALLERIVKDQRDIITGVTQKPVTATPQLWALYKEVQDYYDKGMRVPDDVTLLLCDDNWGNIRKLPLLKDSSRIGGYGIYYHFDYVGGPRNYKWLNTNPLPRIWEQMNLAYQYKATKIWLVNVGDIKPLELPTQFFLDYAWNPSVWNGSTVKNYTTRWAEQQFGETNAKEIARVLDGYAKINGRRKPELLSPETYSIHNFREAETVVSQYRELLNLAETINKQIPASLHDAYYQLVLHPVKASANLHELYFTVARNRLYAEQGRSATNDLAEKASRLFDNDAAISDYYNHTMLNGKWNHMMDQTHISYTNWQQPSNDVLPEVKTIKIPQYSDPALGVEGSSEWWGDAEDTPPVLTFDIYTDQERYFEIFNRGQGAFPFEIRKEPWIQTSSSSGHIQKEMRITVSIDWDKAPVTANPTRVPIDIITNGATLRVLAEVFNPVSPKKNKVSGHVETDGCISIEAEHFSKAINTATGTWTILPDHGRTLSAVTITPVTLESTSPGSGPVLEYNFYSFHEGTVTVKGYFSPTLNFHGPSLRYAIAIDDEAPQTISLHENFNQQAWEKSVANNINIRTSKHLLKKKGPHTLKFYMIDAGVVLQKLVIETKNIKDSYLGPPESFWKK